MQKNANYIRIDIVLLHSYVIVIALNVWYIIAYLKCLQVAATIAVKLLTIGKYQIKG